MQVILLEKIALTLVASATSSRSRMATAQLPDPDRPCQAPRKAAHRPYFLEARRAELEAAQAERIVPATKIADTINEGEIEISSKCGVDGRLFGSVSATGLTLPKPSMPSTVFQIKKSQVARRSAPSGLSATTSSRNLVFSPTSRQMSGPRCWRSLSPLPLQLT